MSQELESYTEPGKAVRKPFTERDKKRIQEFYQTLETDVNRTIAGVRERNPMDSGRIQRLREIRERIKDFEPRYLSFVPANIKDEYTRSLKELKDRVKKLEILGVYS